MLCWNITKRKRRKKRIKNEKKMRRSYHYYLLDSNERTKKVFSHSSSIVRFKNVCPLDKIYDVFSIKHVYTYVCTLYIHSYIHTHVHARTVTFMVVNCRVLCKDWMKRWLRGVWKALLTNDKQTNRGLVILSVWRVAWSEYTALW